MTNDLDGNTFLAIVSNLTKLYYKTILTNQSNQIFFSTLWRN